MNEISAMSPAPPSATRPSEPPREAFYRRRVSLVGALRELWQYRELVLTLAERDLRVRYKQALLGVAWALVTPLLLMAAFALLFTRVTKVDHGDVPYALFASVGLVPWAFFSSAFARGGVSLVSNIPLLNKLYCPREVFPLSAIALAIVDAAASAVVLALVFPITGYAPHIEGLYAPLFLLIILCFTIGVTLGVAVIVVYLRDLQVLLPLVVQFGLFVTPVAYGSSTLVHGSTGRAIFGAINPLAPAIDGLRRTILFGQSPEWTPLLTAGASSLVVLALGFFMFKRLEAGIADIA